jgi:hypothetical protein
MLHGEIICFLFQKGFTHFRIGRSIIKKGSYHLLAIEMLCDMSQLMQESKPEVVYSIMPQRKNNQGFSIMRCKSCTIYISFREMGSTTKRIPYV